MLAAALLVAVGCSDKASEGAAEMERGKAPAEAASAGPRQPQPTSKADPQDAPTVPTTTPPITRGLEREEDKGLKQEKLRVFQATASDIEGRIEPSSVEKTLSENQEKLRACIRTDTSAVVKLKVQPSGRVTESKVKTVPHDGFVRDCLAAALQRVSFPRLSGAEPASFSVDLRLKKEG